MAGVSEVFKVYGENRKIETGGFCYEKDSHSLRNSDNGDDDHLWPQAQAPVLFMKNEERMGPAIERRVNGLLALHVVT